MQLLYVGESNLVEIDDLRTSSDQNIVSTATVTGQLYEENGTTTNGSPITLALTDASLGRYQGNLPSSLSLTVGSIYFLAIAVSGGGLTGARRIKCQAVRHQEIP